MLALRAARGAGPRASAARGGVSSGGSGECRCVLPREWISGRKALVSRQTRRRLMGVASGPVAL